MLSTLDHQVVHQTQPRDETRPSVCISGLLLGTVLQMNLRGCTPDLAQGKAHSLLKKAPPNRHGWEYKAAPNMLPTGHVQASKVGPQNGLSCSNAVLLLRGLRLAPHTHRPYVVELWKSRHCRLSNLLALQPSRTSLALAMGSVQAMFALHQQVLGRGAVSCLPGCERMVACSPGIKGLGAVWDWDLMVRIHRSAGMKAHRAPESAITGAEMAGAPLYPPWDPAAAPCFRCEELPTAAGLIDTSRPRALD